jgi:hypothetical protein
MWERAAALVLVRALIGAAQSPERSSVRVPVPSPVQYTTTAIRLQPGAAVW